jgi:thiol:disulfide interchange protein
MKHLRTLLPPATNIVLLAVIIFISPVAFAQTSVVENKLSFSDKITQLSSNKIKQDLPVYSKIYDDTRDPFKDAKAALTLAKETHRNVLIEVGGNWCSWCKAMDVFLEENPQVYKRLHSDFVILKINVSDSNENAEFMKSLPPVMGYPHMYVSTSTGKMLLSKDTAELHEDGANSVNKWLAFIEKWQLTPVTQTPVLVNNATH